MSLEEYLRGTYLEEKRELVVLREQLREVLPVFLSTWKDGWPYELIDRNAPGEIGTSHSTTAMIAYTLAVLSGKITKSELIPKISSWNESDELVDECGKELDDPFKKSYEKEFKGRLDWVVDEAVAKCVALVEKSNSATGAAIASDSSTFGFDDPLTLSWLTELFESFPEDKNKTALDNVRIAGKATAARVFEKTDEAKDNSQLGVPLKWDDKVDSKSLEHAFPYLRCLHLDRGARKDRYWRYFEETIHLHLSYSLIPDSRFDPAELVFALEGAVLTNRDRLDDGTIARTFRVLEECQTHQEHNPYWRPTKPFVSTKRGTVLFPISVEIANSLLRTLCRLDEGRLHDSYFARHVGLLRRYKQWILARVVTGETKGDAPQPLRKFRGWHSEHVGGRETIHLWETSQVALFLFHYQAMVRQHIARQSLIYSGFTLRRPRKADQGAWNKFAEGEPFHGATAASAFGAYHKIGDKFIHPRDGKTDGASKNWAYSMLLYGPPGTGKTMIAEKIADALGYRLITITASDFLAAGAAAVEARAKAVFDALQEQRETVILFDEMDHFLLDRGSALYREQDSMFQLMTPGMLTKINDLRAKSRSIFIIATNYAERIDPAIKRPGRIDLQILLLPPTRKRRREILEERLNEYGGELPNSDDLDLAAADTELLTWKELDSLAKEASTGSGGRVEELVQLAKAFEPSIKTTDYKNRFMQQKEPKALEGPKPFREFAAVAYIKHEPNESSQQESLGHGHTIDHFKNWEKLLKKELPTIPPEVRDELVKEAPTRNGSASEATMKGADGNGS